MVLVGIFTKLGLEKAQGPQTEMTVSRTLTDLLKQPGHGPSEHVDGLMGDVQVPLGEGLARGPPRTGTDKPPLNNAVAIAPPLGRPHGHGKRLPLASGPALPPPAYAAYATLRAGGECRCRTGRGGGRVGRLAPEAFYRRFGGPEASPTGTLP
ncbi:SHSA8 protein, partial [Glaucidium brasilianum]|nr:SHSA8 protein [Glaucidium brasilianum]